MDQHSGYVVTLNTEVREDDSQEIMRAIKLLKGVLSVDPLVADPTHFVTKRVIMSELRDKIARVLFDDILK